MKARFSLGMPQHAIARDLRIGSVRKAIGVQRRDQRHLVLGAPRRVSADEVERIGAGSLRRPGRDGDDHPQKLAAMRFRFLSEFRIDGVSVLRTFPLQEIEGILPDRLAPLAQRRNDARRQQVFFKSLAPLGDQAVGTCARHGLCNSTTRCAKLYG